MSDEALTQVYYVFVCAKIKGSISEGKKKQQNYQVENSMEVPDKIQKGSKSAIA